LNYSEVPYLKNSGELDQFHIVIPAKAGTPLFGAFSESGARLDASGDHQHSVFSKKAASKNRQSAEFLLC